MLIAPKCCALDLVGVMLFNKESANSVMHKHVTMEMFTCLVGQMVSACSVHGPNVAKLTSATIQLLGVEVWNVSIVLVVFVLRRISLIAGNSPYVRMMAMAFVDIAVEVYVLIVMGRANLSVVIMTLMIMVFADSVMAVDAAV